MSLANVRPYFKSRMAILGYEEWAEDYSPESIPSSILEKTFNLESGVVESTASSHQPHRFLCPVILRVFIKGFNNPSDAVDRAYELSEDILADILLPANRTLTSGILDIAPTSIQVEPLNTANDNSVILRFDFDVVTYINF